MRRKCFYSVFDHKLRVDFAHKIDRHFDDASVVGDKTVHFLFDVAHFGVDSCGKTFVDFRDYRVRIQFFNRFCNLFGSPVNAVSELIVGTVHVTFRLDCVSAEFTENIASVVVSRHEQGLEVDVQALCIRSAFALVVPTAYGVDKASGIDLFHLLGDADGVELSPTFVERHPDCERNYVFEMIHRHAKFSFKFISAFFVGASELFVACFVVVFDVVFKHGGEKTYIEKIVFAAAADHILPHENAFFVAVIIPAERFDFDMLAKHIEAHGFDHLHVPFESGV